LFCSEQRLFELEKNIVMAKRKISWYFGNKGAEQLISTLKKEEFYC